MNVLNTDGVRDAEILADAEGSESVFAAIPDETVAYWRALFARKYGDRRSVSMTDDEGNCHCGSCDD
jgi:hypothetical protein